MFIYLDKMKIEKEAKWLLLLYDSPFVRDLTELKISPKPACKKDFERLVDSSENNKDFNEWFKKLIAEEVFIFVGKNSRGARNNVFADEYIVNAGNLIRYFKLNPLYAKMKKLIFRGRLVI